MMSWLRMAIIIFALVVVPFLGAMGYGLYSVYGRKGVVWLGIALGFGLAYMILQAILEGLGHGLFWLIMQRRSRRGRR